MSYYGYFHTPTQAELREKARKATKKDYHPIVLSSKTISSSWWGKAWCDNIDYYADAYNRLDRGKKYVRADAVVDLNINGGRVDAKVVGSRKTPYDVTVVIDPVKKENYEKIVSVAEGKLKSLDALEKGEFPKEYRDLFTMKGEGLFPRLNEIRFSCSCPDPTRICKHIAAVLYAIGSRLDDNPLLFLSLRGIDVKDFTERLIKKEAARIWQSVGTKIEKERLIDEKEAEALFGFEAPPSAADESEIKKVLKSLQK
jgi:uncharacterized Zn finger protein